MIFGILGIILIGCILFFILALTARLEQTGKAKWHVTFFFVFLALFCITAFSFVDIDIDEIALVKEDNAQTEQDNNNNNEASSETKQTSNQNNDTNEMSKNNEVTDTANEAEMNENDSDNPKDKDKNNFDSIYEVSEEGGDLKPGDYMVVTTDPEIGYMEANEVSHESVKNIIYNDNFFHQDENAYITLKEGEYFKANGMEIYPVDEYELEPEDGLFKSGMYKVGKDIEPGEYDVFLDESDGFLEVNEGTRHDVTDMVHSEVFEEDTDVEVSEGEYLKLEGGHIEVD